jgi:hypothetical protein
VHQFKKSFTKAEISYLRRRQFQVFDPDSELKQLEEQQRKLEEERNKKVRLYKIIKLYFWV